MTLRRLGPFLLSAALLVGTATLPATGSPRIGVSQIGSVGASRWVDVAVATVWASPRSPRKVDAPALTDPANAPAWLARMTLKQRYDLYRRVETQAVYGTEVTVLATKGSWTKVAVRNQPSQHHQLGYPGWIPTAQLGEQAPGPAAQRAVVVRPTASVFSDRARTQRVMTLSYATTLPAIPADPQSASATPGASASPIAPTGPVALLGVDGATWYIDPTAVALLPPGSASPSGEQLVAEARKFLGLPYLWGGNGGWGYDCSGLTESVYARFGVTIPRDATPQYNFAGATKVARADLRAGDLVFFRTPAGTIHHVGMYVGSGQFIHSPRTGAKVRINSLSSQPYSREFAGGRRYLP